MPKRIQRSRAKGWRMPDGAIYVGRPTRFGNPYWDVKRYGIDLCLEMFQATAMGIWDPNIIAPDTLQRTLWLEWLYRDHCEWIKRMNNHPMEQIRASLRGYDLACWCPLTNRCHADILLAIAND